MASNGLRINEGTFCDLTGKEQNLVLFRNIYRVEEKVDGLIETLTKKDNSYQVNKKIQYWWLSGLTTVFLGYLGIRGKIGL